MYPVTLATDIGRYMASCVPGLPVDLAIVWAGSESGTQNNPYGLTNAAGHLIAYPSWQSGTRAAASWLLTGPYYAGVRAALKGGNPFAIMHAIQTSPWGPPGYYTRTWPGVAAAYGIGLPAAPAGQSGGSAPVSVDISTLSPLARAEHYVANLTAALARGVTTTTAGQPVAEALAHWRGVVAALSAPPAVAPDPTPAPEPAPAPEPPPAPALDAERLTEARDRLVGKVMFLTEGDLHVPTKAIVKYIDDAFAALAAPAPAPELVNGVPLTTPTADNAEHDREMTIFVAAQDAVLIAAGKPAGHDGAERGSLPLATNIALAQVLGLPLLVAEFTAQLVPGVSQ